MDILLIISVIPSLVLGGYIYKKDSIEKEDSKLLFLLFLFGFLSLFAAAFIENTIDIFIPSFYDQSDIIMTFIGSFLGIGLVEEILKWIVLRIFTWKHSDFNHIYDAIVYAVFVSLGFATIENVLYVTQNGILTGLVRMIASVPGHVFFGVFMGYYYGMAKKAFMNNRKDLERKNMLLSIIIPICLHGFFDFCLLAQSYLALLVYLFFLIILYIMAFKKVKQLSSVSLMLDNLPYNPTIHEVNAPVVQVMVPSTNTLNQESSVVTSSYCPHCGKPAVGNFCPHCGKPLH